MKIQSDKQLHFLGSMALMFAAYLLLYNISLAIMVALSIGISKELGWDLWMKKGTPDIYDMVANLSGVLFAVAFIFITIGIR